MKRNKLIMVMIAMALLAGIYSATAQMPTGKELFNSNCASCHNVNINVTGPALNGVEQRHSVNWIRGFVRSSQTVIKSGDEKAVALYEKFNRITMPDHPNLTDENITELLAFIKAESKDLTKEKKPFALPPGHRKLTNLPLSWSTDKYLILGYVGVVVVLIIAMLLAVYQKQLQRMKNPEPKRQ